MHTSIRAKMKRNVKEYTNKWGNARGHEGGTRVQIRKEERNSVWGEWTWQGEILDWAYAWAGRSDTHGDMHGYKWRMVE